MPIDYEELEKKLKEELGAKFDEALESKKQEKKLPKKEAAMYLMARDVGIKIPQVRQIREFKPTKIADIVSDARDTIAKLISAGLEGEELNDEFKDSHQEWVQTVGIFAGWIGKPKTYKVKSDGNRPDLSITGALVDDSGTIKFRVWKKDAVNRFRKEMKAGNVYGLGSVTTAYYDEHDSITLNAHEKSDIIPDAKLEMDFSKLGKLEMLESYEFGLFKMNNVGMIDKRTYKGCPNVECSKFSKGQNFDNCRECQSKTEMLPNYEFGAMNNGQLFELSVPYFNTFDGVEKLDGLSEAYLVIGARPGEDEMKYVCVGALFNSEAPNNNVSEEESLQRCGICGKEASFEDEMKAAESGWVGIKGVIHCPECKENSLDDNVKQKSKPEPKKVEKSVEETPEAKMQKIQVKKFMMSKGTLCLNDKVNKKGVLEVYSEGIGIKKDQLLQYLNALVTDGFLEFDEKANTYKKKE